MIPGLDILIDEILSIAKAQIQSKWQRSECVIKLLKTLGLDPDHPPSDFTAVYQYTLVEYGIGKPRYLLELFRHPDIQKTFREAFEQNRFLLLEQISSRIIETDKCGNEIRRSGVDWRRELVTFSATFIKVARRTQTPAEVLRDQRLCSLHEQILSLQETLKRLPTVEAVRTEMARLAAQETLALPSGEGSHQWAQQCRADALAQQMRGWFETLGFHFEPYEAWETNYFEWIINIPVRRGRYDRVLVRGVDGEAGLKDVAALRQAVSEQQTDEGWLVTARRIARSVRNEITNEKISRISCYTFDELIDQDADFNNYLQWLSQEIEWQQIDQKYVPLACIKEEYDSVFQKCIGVSRYDEQDGWIDGYVDRWLDDPVKEHISVLGEFGTGKTWFALHYAGLALKRYNDAKQRGLERPRLPLVISLRNYAKAVSVESLFSEFFFRQYKVPLPHYDAFVQLNRMGKLLLIFDGFDEMAARVDRQEMINNFWELAKVVVPGSKVILTCRTEHFPEAKEGRALLSAELKNSVACLTGEAPQFEILELEKFNDAQIRQVLSFQTRPEVVERVMSDPQLIDLARRPLMIEMILTAMPDIEAGKPIDLSRVYLYAVQQKIERDVETERTFTSIAEKLYFLCELSWEMLFTSRMSLNYREFPDRIRKLFGGMLQKEKTLDYWQYDMLGKTMLIRSGEGDYALAHRSLLEFLVAYKLVAALGLLAPDFTEIAKAQSYVDDDLQGKDYNWSNYFQRQFRETGEPIKIPPLRSFICSSMEELQQYFEKAPLSKALIDLAVPMLDRQKYRQQLLMLIQTTRGQNRSQTGFFSSNLVQLLLAADPHNLEQTDLSYTVLSNINFGSASLRWANLTGADLTDSVFASITGWARSVSFSPDGKKLVLGDTKGSIQIWDVTTGRMLLFLQAHADEVNSVAFSPNGQKVISSGRDKTVRLWDLNGRSTSQPFEGINGEIEAVIFSPNGQLIACAGSTLGLWNLEGKPIGKPFQVHDWIASIAFSPNGQLIACSEGKTIQLWDLNGNLVEQPFQGHQETICAVAFSPDGQKLASSSRDGTICLWDLEGNPIGQLFEGHQGAVNALAFFPDGQKIVSCGNDFTIRLWELNGTPLGKPFRGHRDWIFAISVSPDGEQIASACADATVRFWDLSGNSVGQPLQGCSLLIWAVAFSPDGQHLISGASGESVLRFWDLSGKPIGKPWQGHKDSIFSVAFSPDGHWAASAGADGIRLWDMQRDLKSRLLTSCKTRSVAFSPDSSRIVSTEDKMLRLWNLDGDSVGFPFEGHEAMVWAVAFSPDGNRMISGGYDRALRLWDLDGNLLGQPFQGHEDRITSVAFSPDGQKIISGSGDGTIRLWNLQGELISQPFQGHKRLVWSVAFSPDGQRIVSGSVDQTIRIWNLTGSPVCQPLYNPEGIVFSIAISPDGRYIASGSLNSIRIWSLDTAECLRLIDCNICTGLDISEAVGLSAAQKTALKLMGACEKNNLFY